MNYLQRNLNKKSKSFMWLFSLVSVVFILCFGDFVFAESAWILWNNETKFKGSSQTAEKEWKIEQSFQTMKECQEYLKDFIYQQKKHYDAHAAVAANVEGNKGAITILFNKQSEEKHVDNLIRRDLICLLDTIDPRSQKH